MVQVTVRYRIVIPIAIASVILVAAFYPSLILLKYHSIDITGRVKVVDTQVHGYSYIFTPEQTEASKLGKIEPNQSILLVDYDKLSPELQGKKIRIQGTFIEDYDQYQLETFQSAWLSGDPSGLVILVKDIQTLESSIEPRLVDITGTVDYTGIPEPEEKPIHGYKYIFVPEEEEISKLGEAGINKLTLLDGDKLSPELEGEKVLIHGIFIENYKDYKQFVESTDPWGPVIIVKEIQTLKAEVKTYPSIDIIGIVDYEGIPYPGQPIHGFNYRFIVEEEEISKLGEAGINQLTLWGADKLIPELDGKKVRIQGTFIENYDEYVTTELKRPMLSAEPSGPVIIVKNIEILT